MGEIKVVVEMQGTPTFFLQSTPRILLYKRSCVSSGVVAYTWISNLDLSCASSTFWRCDTKDETEQADIHVSVMYDQFRVDTQLET